MAKGEAYKYFLAIVPPSPFLDEAESLKKEAHSRFNSKGALNSPPHITLHMPFEMTEARIGELETRLTVFASNRDPFLSEIKGWGAFPPRVVFLNVLLSNELKNLHSDLVKLMKVEFYILNADFRKQAFQPHLTIAFRDLKRAVFQDAMNHFSNRKIEWYWMVSSIALLKHDNKRWNIFKVFPFKS